MKPQPTSESPVNARTPAQRQRCSPASGFTLIEVVIGLSIIGMSAMAALVALLFSYRVSDANLRALAATANARAVAEKVVTLDYGSLALPAWNLVDIPSLPNGALNVGQWNNRTDDIHNTPTNANDDLVFRIWPEVALSKTVSGFECAQVIIRYEWNENSFFATHTRQDAITVLVSSVPTY